MSRSDIPKPWTSAGHQREGGQGWVEKVCRPADERFYALKRLKNPKRNSRFEREVHFTKALHDRFGRSFPEVVEVGTTAKGRPYYVMPWYDDSLQDALGDQRYAKDSAAGVALLVELAQILELLHQEHHAHRDLKPANVLIDKSGHLVALL